MVTEIKVRYLRRVMFRVRSVLWFPLTLNWKYCWLIFAEANIYFSSNNKCVGIFSILSAVEVWCKKELVRKDETLGSIVHNNSLSSATCQDKLHIIVKNAQNYKIGTFSGLPCRKKRYQQVEIVFDNCYLLCRSTYLVEIGLPTKGLTIILWDKQ